MKPRKEDSTPDRSPWVAAGIGVVLLLGWEFASRASKSVSFLVSSPSQIWDALAAMAISGTLLSDIGVTAWEALAGTIVGTVLGSAVGLALWLSKRATRVAAPFVVVAANFPQERFGGVFDGFRASRWDTYKKVIVPGALDAVFSSMRVNVGLGILGA